MDIDFVRKGHKGAVESNQETGIKGNNINGWKKGKTGTTKIRNFIFLDWWNWWSVMVLKVMRIKERERRWDCVLSSTPVASSTLISCKHGEKK